MFSARKNAEDLKKALEEVVVPMFCNTSIGITEEQQTKLNKVLSVPHTVLWSQIYGDCLKFGDYDFRMHGVFCNRRVMIFV
jgi:hypothetical protein